MRSVKFLRRDLEAPGPRALPEMLLETLDLLDGDSMILAPGEIPLFITAGVETLGILKDGRIQSSELLATVRVVRRTHIQQVGVIEIPRGPIGEGKHELTVKVLPLTRDDLVLVLISDESEAQRVHDVRRDFVANISHELKTPIGALSILSEAVLEASNDPEAIAKFASRMQSEAKRLSGLVQEIIDLSRLQDDDPLKNGKVVDLSDSITEAIDQSRLNAEKRKITLVFEGVADVKINGDRGQVIMAINNLIENAINYSPDNTRVAITLKVIDSIAEVAVSDQGIGIPEKDLERIFERFYRVDPARSRLTGGTGLGLSIVKHIATNHGGDVSLWSVEGAGSTFTIRFPLIAANLNTNQTQSEGKL